MANKTQANENSVADFLEKVEPQKRKEDAFTLLKIMEEISGEKAKMWGDSIIGYGTYHYKYESGREGDFLRIGFSPRKTALSLYIMSGFSSYEQLMKKLGKHKTGKACLYIKKLEDVDLAVLKELMKASLEYMKEKYG
jgi:hypothetical protein